MGFRALLRNLKLDLLLLSCHNNPLVASIVKFDWTAASMRLMLIVPVIRFSITTEETLSERENLDASLPSSNRTYWPSAMPEEKITTWLPAFWNRRIPV